MDTPRPRGRLVKDDALSAKSPRIPRSKIATVGQENGPSLRISKIAKPVNFTEKGHITLKQRNDNTRGNGSKEDWESKERSNANAENPACMENSAAEFGDAAPRLASKSRLNTFAQMNSPTVNRRGVEDVEGGKTATQGRIPEKLPVYPRKITSQRDHACEELVSKKGESRIKPILVSENSGLKRSQFGFQEERVAKNALEKSVVQTSSETSENDLKTKDCHEDSNRSKKPLQCDPPGGSLQVKPIQSSLAHSSFSVSKTKKPAELSRELKKPMQCDARKPMQCEFARPDKDVVVGCNQKEESSFAPKMTSFLPKHENCNVVARARKVEGTDVKGVDKIKSDIATKRALNFGGVTNHAVQVEKVERTISGDKEEEVIGIKHEAEKKEGFLARGNAQNITDRQGKSENSLAKVKPTKAKKFEAFKYDERQEIKPRGMPLVNKGHVSKSLDEANRIVSSKEPAICKRVAIGKDTVDCNLHKKQARERKQLEDKCLEDRQEATHSKFMVNPNDETWRKRNYQNGVAEESNVEQVQSNEKVVEVGKRIESVGKEGNSPKLPKQLPSSIASKVGTLERDKEEKVLVFSETGPFVGARDERKKNVINDEIKIESKLKLIKNGGDRTSLPLQTFTDNTALAIDISTKGTANALPKDAENCATRIRSLYDKPFQQSQNPPTVSNDVIVKVGNTSRETGTVKPSLLSFSNSGVGMSNRTGSLDRLRLKDRKRIRDEDKDYPRLEKNGTRLSKSFSDPRISNENMEYTATNLAKTQSDVTVGSAKEAKEVSQNEARDFKQKQNRPVVLSYNRKGKEFSAYNKGVMFPGFGINATPGVHQSNQGRAVSAETSVKALANDLVGNNKLASIVESSDDNNKDEAKVNVGGKQFENECNSEFKHSAFASDSTRDNPGEKCSPKNQLVTAIERNNSTARDVTSKGSTSPGSVDSSTVFSFRNEAQSKMGNCQGTRPRPAVPPRTASIQKSYLLTEGKVLSPIIEDLGNERLMSTVQKTSPIGVKYIHGNFAFESKPPDVCIQKEAGSGGKKSKKSKRGNFIASLVKLLQEGRDSDDADAQDGYDAAEEMQITGPLAGPLERYGSIGGNGLSVGYGYSKDSCLGKDAAISGQMEANTPAQEPQTVNGIAAILQAPNQTQDFITIPGKKDNKECNNSTRLSSFSTGGKTKGVKVDEGDAVEGQHVNTGGAKKEESETQTMLRLNQCLNNEDATEVEENLRKLYELNALRDSIKLSQRVSAKSKLKFAKRKSKKSGTSWWENGVSEFFYSANEDAIADEVSKDGAHYSSVNEDNNSLAGKKSRRETASKLKDNIRFDLPEMDLINRNHCNALTLQGPRSGSIADDNINEHVNIDEMSSQTCESSLPYYKSVVKRQKAEYPRDEAQLLSDSIKETNGCLICPDSSESRAMEFGIRQSEVNSPVKIKPSAKVKPYTVVDLSTMSALSPEEVDDCLKEVSVAEKIRWESQAGCGQDDNNEAPDGVVLPPKSNRNRSNTTATESNTRKEDAGDQLRKLEDLPLFPTLKIVGMDYSCTGKPLQNQELSSFRSRSKTAPAGNNDIHRAAEDARASIHNKETLVNEAISFSMLNSKGAEGDPCKTASRLNGKQHLDMYLSQDFPPPPSQEELVIEGKEADRSKTPDWPPVPESADQSKNPLNGVHAWKDEKSSCNDKPHVLEKENSGNPLQETDITSTGCNVDVKTGLTLSASGTYNPHRSLPPIPGGHNPEVSSVKDESPLAWVSRATHVGTGPYIPMCDPDEMDEDLTSSHFYDDIDQISKIAKERAMMIKRLEEEEAKQASLSGNEDENARSSLGYMPDLIPNEVEAKATAKNDGSPEFERNDAKTNSKRSKKNVKKEDKVSAKSVVETKNPKQANDIAATFAEPPLTVNEKKRSAIRKLLRKFSAPIKSSDRHDFGRQKATTPQLAKKNMAGNAKDNNKSDIFATPATSRRLFSLSSHRNQRQRTISDSEALRQGIDDDIMADQKRSKNRTGTISFGFVRKKAKKDALNGIIPSDDEQSVRSLELLRISEDFSSESGSSTRITPATSPVLSFDDNCSRKYRAPQPPTCSAETINIDDNTFEGQSDSGVRQSGEKLARHYEKVNEVLNACDRDVDEKRKDSREEANAHQDVFKKEGAYDNYPPSKSNAKRPTKPPRSESEDKETNKKAVPKKPRRIIQGDDSTTRPEPYSSQRGHRQVNGEHEGISARLSPTLSNSEDDSNESNSQDSKPWQDYAISTNPDLRSLKSSTSDCNLFGRLGRGNRFYQSDRTMDRPSRLRRRGSLSNDSNRFGPQNPDYLDDSYYENVDRTSPTPGDGLLRYTTDSYEKLLEIHRDTVKQIAEATFFKCDCGELKNTDWNDFEVCGKLLNYGLSSYVTVPVVVKKQETKEAKKHTAWLRQSLGFLQGPGSVTLKKPVQELTRHENLLHICQDILRSRDDDERTDEVPRDIHVNRMLVSKCTPRMGLTKYLSMTMDKHARDPETFEKEACLILLQVLKGLCHLGKSGAMVDDISCESILLTDVNKGVLSPNFVNNNNGEMLGCPTVMYVALPGLIKEISAKKITSISEQTLKGEGYSKGSKDANGGTGLEDKRQKSKVTDEGVTLDDCDEGVTLDASLCKEFMNLIFEVFHASHLLSGEIGLDEEEECFSEVPKLPVKSQYSQRLQPVIERLSLQNGDCVSINSLIKQFQVIAFCPVLMGRVEREDLVMLLDKWRNRRCVDMVSDILKKHSLISLASGLASGGTNSMGLARNCVLECQFLGDASTEEMSSIVSFIEGY